MLSPYKYICIGVRVSKVAKLKNSWICKKEKKYRVHRILGLRVIVASICALNREAYVYCVKCMQVKCRQLYKYRIHTWGTSVLYMYAYCKYVYMIHKLCICTNIWLSEYSYSPDWISQREKAFCFKSLMEFFNVSRVTSC